MKKLTSLLLVLCLAFSLSTFTFASEAAGDAALNAQTISEIASDSASMQEDHQIKNVIFMIPDGGGPTLMDLADMVKQAGGIDRTKYPYSTVTDNSPLHLLSYLAGFETTRSANNPVTDSAAGGTALSSGYKTKNGYVGITSAKIPRATILEAAMYKGKATGMVTIAEWPHATPASYSAHTTDRNDYYNIYKQIENKEIQVVLGGGYGTDTEFEGATIQNAIDNGYKIVATKEDAKTIQPGDKVWGNVGSKKMPEDHATKEGRPVLHELVSVALTALSGDEDGFFLMVEGSNVDAGGHNSNAFEAISEYLAFDAAWKVAVDFAKGRNDTIVIGAPDHDTGGLVLPKTWTNEIELIQQGGNPDTFTWKGNGGHTDLNCPVWVYLPEGVEMLEGLSPVVGDSASVRSNYLIDNTAFAPYLASFMDADLDAISSELFVDVTTIGNYDEETEKFVFNNGDKYIYKNTDTYYENGEAVDMHGEVAVFISERFYVPAQMIDEEDWNHVNTGVPDTMAGEGTLESPYLIESASDFKEILSGMRTLDYKDVYFKQIDDLEFTDDSALGLDDTLTFAGNYNGNGKTITWNGTYDKAVALFPTVSGTIANLGVLGTLTSTESDKSASIAHTVASTGKIINCYSQLDYEGEAFNGIAVNNAGEIINTYYGGTSTVTNGGSPIADGGAYTSSYYVSTCGIAQISPDVFVISEEDSKDALASLLTSGAAKVQARTDVTLVSWESFDSLPEFAETDAIVTRVRLYPEAQTIAKGDKFQFTANVDGKYDYSWGINWGLTPQSDLAGTFIDDNGVVYIDENETITSFTVTAKSLANGAVADSAVITVGEKTVYPEGDGTKENPYLITCEKDFFDFTQNLLDGEKYSGVYFKQTRDLDMAGYPEYSGMGQKGNFYGIYDGAGHVINLDIEGDQGCAFPYLYGTIMNLGTTGKVNNTNMAAGICRAARETGIIVNCWSTVDSKANTNASGISASAKSTSILANIYFAGTYTILDTEDGYGGVISNNGKYTNNFYLADETVLSEKNSKMTESDMKTVMCSYLNAGREAAAEAAGLSVDDLTYWVNVEDGYPTQTVIYPFEEEISEIKIFPEDIEMFKGDSRQLGISPTGLGYDAVTWSIEDATSEDTTVDEYGFVTIGLDEELDEINVKATLKSDTTISDVITINVAEELDHIAAYREDGYEIIYLSDALTKTVLNNTAPDKKVVFALKSDIKTSSDKLSHNGGTIVFTSAGGDLDIGTRNLNLGEDLDADIIFDNIAVNKGDSKRGINVVGNNLTLTGTFTTSTTNDTVLNINANNDSDSSTSNGNTITIETASKITVSGSGYSGNLTNGDVTYVFGKSANASLTIAGKAGKEDVQARLNGNAKVIVKDSATLSISVAENKAYIEGNLDIEIKDNANVTKISLNKAVGGNAYIDIKGGTVGAITVTADMVTGKSVIKANTDKATLGEITGADYVVNYNGNLGDVECSEDYASISLTPNASVKYVRVTNGDTVKEYTVAGEEVELLADLSALDLAKGTTTVEFLTDGEIAPTADAVFNANGGAWGEETTITVVTKIGEVPTAPEAPVYAGYVFNGWTPELAAMTAEGATYTATWEKELDHIAAYRAAGYEIVYIEDSFGTAVSDNTAAGKKVVFALKKDIKLSSNLTLSHNGGTIVFTSAGGTLNLSSKSLILGKDKDADITFDNIAVNKTTGERSINAVGNNLTLTETFTTTTSDSNPLYINANSDSGSLESDGNTVTIETSSKVGVRASGASGNLTNGDVTYVFGKNATGSLLVAGKVTKTDGTQTYINGDVKVIVKDNAKVSISIAENYSYLKGNLDIEIKDNANVTSIKLNKKIESNAHIDIKGGTVGANTVTADMVTGKSVIKANTDKATLSDITGADYVVKYNGNLGDVAYSSDFKSVSLTPDDTVASVIVTNGDTVNEYGAEVGEVTLAAGTTTIEFVEGEAPTTANAIFNANGGAWGEETTKTVETVIGEVPTAPEAPVYAGYIFKGWTPELTAITVDGATYTAIWEKEAPKTAIATFNANGGAWGEETTKTVETVIGEVPTAPEAPVYAGYIFKGWTPELTAITVDGATYTATWEKELDHIAAYRAAGYEIIYADTNNKTTFKGMVNENTAPGKKVVFALMQNMGNTNSFDIEPMGGTVVFTSAGGAFRFNGSMKFIADHDADIIFDHMTVTEATADKEIIAYGNNITFTETFKNTTGNALIVYANCNATTESNGNTVTIETDAKLKVLASGATGNATKGDVTYIFGKNANASLTLAGKVTKTDGRQTYVNGDVKVVVKDNATLSKIIVAENYSYLKGNLDIEIKDNANISAINLDKKVDGNAYIDIKGGTVGAITVTDDMVTGKSVIKANTDKATLGEIINADYVVKYNGDLGDVEYSADYEAVALTPDASVKYVRVINGESFKEYNVAGDEVTLLADLSALPISEGTTTVEFLTEGTEVYAITFKDGDTTETQMVSEGTVPTAPVWTKDGYTLSWDKEIVAATEPVTYTAVWTKAGPVEVTDTLKVKFAREDGVRPVNFAKLYIYADDTKSELVNTITLENSETDTATVTVDVTLLEGTYYAEVVKNGYLTFKTDVTVTDEAISISEIMLIPGDIKDSYDTECGDGVVDIDDFIRVLRGFATDATSELSAVVDVNEDNIVNVTDIALIKANFGEVS